MTRDARAATFGWVLSLALHAGMAGYVYWATTSPELGFELALPDEVEFGLTDAVTVSAGAAPPPPSEAPASAGDEGEGEGDPGDPDAGVPLPDAGRAPRDAGPPAVAEAAPPEETGEGAGDRGDGTGDQDGEGDGVAFLPAGSQLALRLDVTRIRESAIAEDVRRLLVVMPDWRNLLGDSGIDPLEDLDRLLIASPNLDRARMILAGRATGQDPSRIRAAAAALAESAGETIEWRTEHGVPVTEWHDPTGIGRVIAIVGPRHFVICRPVDLPRVLAVAHARAAAAEEDGAAEHPADALLSMEEGEGLSLEIEGARNFTRSSRPVEVLPTRARFAMRQLDGGRIGVRSGWIYEDHERADAAESYWNRIREGYANNIIVRTLGLGPILGRATLEATDEHLDGAVDLEVVELQRLLGLGAMFMGRSTRAPGAAPSPPGAAPDPSGAGPIGPRPPTPRLPPPRPPPSPYD